MPTNDERGAQDRKPLWSSPLFPRPLRPSVRPRADLHNCATDVHNKEPHFVVPTLSACSSHTFPSRGGHCVRSVAWTCSCRNLAILLVLPQHGHVRLRAGFLLLLGCRAMRCGLFGYTVVTFTLALGSPRSWTDECMTTSHDYLVISRAWRVGDKR